MPVHAQYGEGPLAPVSKTTGPPLGGPLDADVAPDAGEMTLSDVAAVAIALVARVDDLTDRCAALEARLDRADDRPPAPSPPAR